MNNDADELWGEAERVREKDGKKNPEKRKEKAKVKEALKGQMD